MTISKTAIAALLATTLTSTPAGAEPDSEMTRALGDKLTEAFVVCSAFFTLSARVGRRAGRVKGMPNADASQWMGTRAMKLAESVTKNPEDAMLLFGPASSTLAEAMGGDFKNYARVADDLMHQCIELVDAPEATVARRGGSFPKGWQLPR